MKIGNILNVRTSEFLKLTDIEHIRIFRVLLETFRHSETVLHKGKEINK